MNYEIFKEDIMNLQNEISEQKRFIEAVIKTPVILFTSADKHLKNHRSAIFHAVKNNVHAFQGFIADNANIYMQQYAIENNITTPFEVRVRKGNSFPSIFAIYSGDIEVLQFNIFEQWYGVQSNPKTEEEILISYKEISEQKQKELKVANERLEKWKSINDSPYKNIGKYYYKNKNSKLKNMWLRFMDVMYIMFRNKKLKEGMSKRVEECINNLKEIEDRFARHAIPKEEVIESNKKKTDLINDLVPFFELFKYSEQTQKHELY